MRRGPVFLILGALMISQCCSADRFACMSARHSPVFEQRWIQDRQDFVSIYCDRMGLTLNQGVVVDDIRNADLYYALAPGIERGLRFLASSDFSDMPAGRQELGDGVYVMVTDYLTIPREKKHFEAHQKYADIHYVARGAEVIGYARVEALHVVEKYDPAKEAAFLEGSGSFVTEQPGTFMILFPGEAHIPGCPVGSPDAVRKVVVKVPVL